MLRHVDVIDVIILEIQHQVCSGLLKIFFSNYTKQTIFLGWTTLTSIAYLCH